MPQDQEKNSPATPGKAHERQKEAVEIVRDVYEGTLRMREKGAKYLPRFPKETTGDYERRRKKAVLYNATRRTVEGLTGMVFRKDPQLSEDVPSEIEEHTDNIDLAGRSLDVFARDFFEASLLDGHAHIFVDYQRTDDSEIRTLADEQQMGVRPYWVMLEKQDVLSWRTRSVNGRPVLTQLVWRETIVRPDGEFGEEEVTRYRVYQRVAAEDEGTGEVRAAVEWQIWEEKEDGEVVPVESGLMDIPVIPLATGYTNRTGFLESDPPLLDLALENVRHYQARSDRAHVLHFASVPIPFFSGVEMDELKWGPNHAISTENEQAAAQILEPSGNGLEEGRLELQDIEQRMAALGLAMLQRDTRAAETAEARRIEKSETDSSLSAAARGLEGALEEALSYHALWMDREDADGGSASVNRDFESQMLDPQMVTTLSGLVGRGQLSVETMWDILERGEILPDDFDPDMERDRLMGTAVLDQIAGQAGGGEPVPSGAGENGAGEGGEGGE